MQMSSPNHYFEVSSSDEKTLALFNANEKP